MKVHTLLGLLAATGFCVASAPVLAAACTGSSVGTSSTMDVSLGSINATACNISGVNPSQGPNGNTSGFSGVYGGGWTLIGKLTSDPDSVTKVFGGVTYTVDFDKTNGKNGTWSVTVSQPVAVDLVFAMHASDHSGSFFFDNKFLPASETSGNWTIKWLNNGGQVPDFSNLVVFAREQNLNPIPEPETYAMLLAGLGAVGWVARRRRPG